MTDKITAHTSKGVSFIQAFMDFIKKFGVIGLALGVVIGSAVKALVDSLVANIVSPILGKIIGAADLSGIVFFDIRVGQFLSDFINFIVLLFVVYIMVKVVIGSFLSEDEKKSLNM
jgi:large conductance mechanosensitive channel